MQPDAGAAPAAATRPVLDPVGFAERVQAISAQKNVEADLRRVPETPQASLLPPRPPTIPGLEVAARYRPAPLPRRLEPALDATGGRSAAIVDEVAASWGGTRPQVGKRVWFELPAPPP